MHLIATLRWIRVSHATCTVANPPAPAFPRGLYRFSMSCFFVMHTLYWPGRFGLSPRAHLATIFATYTATPAKGSLVQPSNHSDLTERAARSTSANQDSPGNLPARNQSADFANPGAKPECANAIRKPFR